MFLLKQVVNYMPFSTFQSAAQLFAGKAYPLPFMKSFNFYQNQNTSNCRASLLSNELRGLNALWNYERQRIFVWGDIQAVVACIFHYFTFWKLRSGISCRHCVNNCVRNFILFFLLFTFLFLCSLLILHFGKWTKLHVRLKWFTWDDRVERAMGVWMSCFHSNQF